MIVLIAVVIALAPFLLLRRAGPAASRLDRMFIGASSLPILLGYVAPALLSRTTQAFFQSDSARKFFTLGGLYLSIAFLLFGLALVTVALRQGRNVRAPLIGATLVAALPLIFVIVVGLLWLGHS